MLNTYSNFWKERGIEREMSTMTPMDSPASFKYWLCDIKTTPGTCRIPEDDTHVSLLQFWYTTTGHCFCTNVPPNITKYMLLFQLHIIYFGFTSFTDCKRSHKKIQNRALSPPILCLNNLTYISFRWKWLKSPIYT